MRFYPSRAHRSSCWSTCPSPVSAGMMVRCANQLIFRRRHQRYHVLEPATLSNGDNRNFVHMKVMVDAGYPLHSRFAKTVYGGGLFSSKEDPQNGIAHIGLADDVTSAGARIGPKGGGLEFFFWGGCEWRPHILLSAGPNGRVISRRRFPLFPERWGHRPASLWIAEN